MEPAAASPRIFYGWYVLAASVVIELFGLGFGIFTITTAYPYIITSFPDWTRTTVFLPTTVIILTVAGMGPLTGAFIDRYPIRYLFVGGIVVQSTALYLFSLVQTPAHYILASALLGLGMSGVTILPNQVLVSRWFHEHVGLVNGIILAATAMGAALSPALVTRVIEASDWRTAFRWMTLLCFAPPMAVVLLLVRDRPEALGLRAYGAERVAAPVGPVSGTTLQEAVREPLLWVFGAAVLLAGVPCYSYTKHILVVLRELGYAPIEAADYKSLFFFVSGCSRLSFGWLCDRFDKQVMVRLHFVCIAAGSTLLTLMPGRPALLLPSLLVLGVGYGGLLPSIPIMSVAYFGRAHLGKILGVYKISYDLAAAGAPLLTAYLFDLYGSYTVPQLWNTAFAWAGVLIAVAGLGPATRSLRRAEESPARIVRGPV